ncbi:MAG: AAA family ATPase, partial [Anaerolineae bacterium]|nr:AAA family ATPase [Anaerolineae bacterium]
MNLTNLELAPEQLRRTTNPESFAFESTAELTPLPHIIGQERAVRSIDFGVDMPSEGYNIFAVGPSGSGRMTAVRIYLDERAEQRPVPAEWCYVYNFSDSRRPKAVSLPAGRASEFSSQMAELVQQFRSEIPRAFEGEPYEERRREIMLEMQSKQQSLYQNLEEYLNERGFALIRTQMGLNIAPMLNGEILSGEAYQKLDPELKKNYEDQRPALQEQFDKTMREARELDREVRKAIDNINNELAGFVVDNLMADIKETFGECSTVLEYLEAVRKDVVANVDKFVSREEEQPQPALLMARGGGERWFDRYQVNVLAENQDCRCAPVIVEDNPTYHNLIGRIEHRAEFGAMVTDFGQIRAGALHRANGGYLVLEAKNLFANPMAWEALKRALR